MTAGERDLADLNLGSDAEARIHEITDQTVSRLEQELARKPQDDPYQEGNILAIWRIWDTSFTNQTAVEQLRQGTNDSAEPEEPGDYPRPDNPLDVPQATTDADPIV
jgi:hypothetical protein